MRNSCTASLIAILTGSWSASAAPPATTLHIHVDQFGYRRTAQKVAVLSDPQAGYNAAEAFQPGAAYQVRRWNDDTVAFSGAPTSWRSGTTHAQSGDRVWHFDFSTLTESGSFYLFDVQNNVGSFRFEIRDDVYNQALEAALRSFYYQRCGTARPAAHAGSNWADVICHLHAQQDADCRSVLSPVPGTSKNLSGGWHDAGDYNKYVNFADGPLHDLLSAYEQFSGAFDDSNNLPESGNGVPDVLDELKYELDWLLRMQQPDGSLLHKVSVTDFSSASPPSADAAFRRYAPATASATVTGAATFAHAAKVFGASPDAGMQAYGATLETAAVNAWQWLASNPGSIPSSYNNQGFQNVAAEDSAYEQTANRVCAAAYLYRLTGNTTYRSYFDSNYQNVHLIQWWFAYPFESEYQDCLLHYTATPGATSSVASQIRSRYQGSVSGNDHLQHYLDEDDAYHAYLADQDYTWGSSKTKASQGSMYVNMLVHGLDAANATHYRNAAEGFVHYMHGINPNATTYLSNMQGLGAENSVQEFYHAWFVDGSVWDNATTSPYGPAPGFVVGGANRSYAPDPAYNGPPIEPPMNQPVQKSFRAWNTSWPENSWEVTENGIYYQAAYIKLLAAYSAADSDGDGSYDFEDCSAADSSIWRAPSVARALRVSGGANAMLSWSAPQDPGGTVVYYDVLRSSSASDFGSAVCVRSGITTTTAADADLPGVGFYYIVRSANACGSNAGTDSSGTPRILPACP